MEENKNIIFLIIKNNKSICFLLKKIIILFSRVFIYSFIFKNYKLDI